MLMYIFLFLAGVIVTLVVLLPILASLRAQKNLLREQVDSLEKKAVTQGQSEEKVLKELAPVNITIKQMQTKIEDFEKERLAQYGALSEALKISREDHERLQKATATLATAMKSNQSRGQWGEVQLKLIVEATGMVQHVSFDTQVGGRWETRPDMVIYLPEGKTIVVDAKAPATDYLKACSIPDLSDEAELQHREELMRGHAKAVRSRVDDLASKKYWENKDFKDKSPDFTIMFLPSEAMLSSALETDPNLLEHAFGKGIALASPISLFSVLKTVSFVWHQQLVSEKAKELGEMSVELLERVRVLAGHSKELAVGLEKAVKSYNSFAKSLESKVLTQVNRIAICMNKSEIDVPKELDFKAHEWKKEELLDSSSD